MGLKELLESLPKEQIKKDIEFFEIFEILKRVFEPVSGGPPKQKKGVPPV